MKPLHSYIAIAILLLICGFLYRELRKKSAENNRKDSIISEKTDSIHHFKTESGRQAVEKSAAIATTSEFEEAYPELLAELKDLKVKVKDLRAIVQVGFQAEGSGTMIVRDTVYQDSVRYKEIYMDDGYLKFGTMWPDMANGRMDKNLPGLYRYTYRDTLTYGFRTERKWFLGKERLYGFGGLKNPQANIRSATNVLIEDYKDKRFSIGPYVGYGLIGNRIDFGVSVQYAVWKF